jgi:hypothetical protein
MTSGPAAAYRQTIDRELGRALSRLDAEPTSRSYGCFDRTWWCWKFTDSPASRFQEGAYLLAWLYTSDHAPDGYRGHARVLSAAEASIRFWQTLQRADGSFDEAYPFERSLAATAFTGFYVGAAVERLTTHMSAETTAAAERGLRGAADWLSANSETHAVISNHLAAAAAALQIAGDRLGSDRYRAARDRYLETILAAANVDEGWFREYDGADPGYQSHAMFYLAEIWKRTGNTQLGAALASASRFMGWFAHPDGTLGGEYASRGTTFAYPAGFEMLAATDRAAAAIASHTRRTIASANTIGPEVVDSWNLFPLMNNYLFAADAAGAIDDADPLPWTQANASATFNACGLSVIRRGHRVAAIGAAAGGAIKVWNAESGILEYQDCGYATDDGGAVALSQAASTWRCDTASADFAIDVDGRFRVLTQARFDPWRFVAFRMFSLTVGRLAVVGRWLKDLLVRTLIRSRRDTGAVLSRRIVVAPDGRVTIEDRVSGARTLRAVDRQVPVHMGSSRYTNPQVWLGATIGCSEPSQAAGGDWHRTAIVKAD